MKTRIIISAFISMITFPMTAQVTTPLPPREGTGLGLSVSADVVNQYIWRGQDLGNVSLQPTLGVEYKGLSLTAWGSVGLSEPDDTKEFDLTLGYTIGGFNVGITDYWFNVGGDPDARYFKYDAHATNHVFEANVGYDFGPVSVQWYTNFAGNDGLNKDGKRAYSSYFEVNVPFKLCTVDWTATAGAVPYATDFYGTTGFAVTNLSLRATKDIKVTDSFSIPIFGQVVGNPCSQKAYLVFGLTLQP
ncbi:MAG: hypothetical protein IJK46_07005 [Prevotella sp.]|nr:hypothetical protein [Prevotella sp.]